MSFGTATVLTSVGKTLTAKQVAGVTSVVPKWIGIGTGATGAARTAVVGDTALTTEVETRAVGTPSVVGGANDTFQTVGTITAGSVRSVDEAGVFDQLAVGGNMFISATFGVVTLQIGDSLQITAKCQYT